MGKLFVINDSFEVKDIDPSMRDDVLIDFCKSVDLAYKAKDEYYGTEDFFFKKHSYGTFYFDLILAGWPQVKLNEHLIGFTSTALSLYQNTLFAFPGLIQNIESLEHFKNSYNQTNKGFTGFADKEAIQPYIACETSWREWNIKWLQEHQNEIKWETAIDNFLPNRIYSEKILLRELKNHGKETSLKKYPSIGIAFHEEIMRKKGNEIEGYTIAIGGEIAAANFYKLERDLSRREQAAVSSLRTIYSLLNSQGNKQYISFDHLHGMFEYHDHTGLHLGEFKFDGSSDSPADITHNLRTL